MKERWHASREGPAGTRTQLCLIRSQHCPQCSVAGCRTNIPPANTTRRQAREKGKSSECVMFPCPKMCKLSSADCCRHSKVCTTRIHSSLPYHIDTQNAVCATGTYIYTNIDWVFFSSTEKVIRMRVIHDDEICYTSLNDQS